MESEARNHQLLVFHVCFRECTICYRVVFYGSNSWICFLGPIHTRIYSHTVNRKRFVHQLTILNQVVIEGELVDFQLENHLLSQCFIFWKPTFVSLGVWNAKWMIFPYSGKTTCILRHLYWPFALRGLPLTKTKLCVDAQENMMGCRAVIYVPTELNGFYFFVNVVVALCFQDRFLTFKFFLWCMDTCLPQHSIWIHLAMCSFRN